jgi:uncharacterized protein YoaH (UPF0181 family)
MLHRLIYFSFFLWLACASLDCHAQQQEEITFERHIAPIGWHKCGECHRRGGPAPFTLLTHRDWVEHAEQIREVLASGTMPPWLPTGNLGEFQGDRRLTQEEDRLVRRWLNQGMSAGEPLALAAAQLETTTWRLGEPTQVVRPQPLVSHQLAHSQNLMVDMPEDDVYVTALELRAWNAQQQQALLWLDLPMGTQTMELQADSSAAHQPYFSLRRVRDRLPVMVGSPFRPVQRARAVDARDRRLIGVWSFDQPAIQFPAGYAFRFPARSRLVLELNQPVREASLELGLHVVSSPPKNLVLAAALEPTTTTKLLSAQEETRCDEFVVPVDSELFALAPFADQRCREVRVNLTLPDGNTESILWINRWDPRWTRTFLLPMAIQVPANSRLEAKFLFDVKDVAAVQSEHSTVLAAQISPVRPAQYDELVRAIQSHQIEVVRTPIMSTRVR